MGNDWSNGAMKGGFRVLFYIILLIAEIIAFVLLFVFIYCEHKAMQEYQEAVEREAHEVLLESQKCNKKCIAAYDDLVKILEKCVEDKGPPNGIEKF
ncbi:MAG: hypothetical protein LUC37_00565 [Prevotella sp.]|nr:hypothetical protein [Prevotella sp.]